MAIAGDILSLALVLVKTRTSVFLFGVIARAGALGGAWRGTLAEILLMGGNTGALAIKKHQHAT